jgi:hypothetical protein
MFNQEKILYFLIFVFLVLLVATIFKLYIVKKNERENFNSGATTTTPNLAKRLNSLENSVNNAVGKNNELVSMIKGLNPKEHTELKANIDRLGSFHDNYNKELHRIIQQNLNVNDSAYEANQEIQESRVRALESQLSELESLNRKDQNKKDNQIRSIICRANSIKLSVEPVYNGENTTDGFIIFLNNECVKVDNNNNLDDTQHCDLTSTSQKFKLKKITNYKEYNDVILREETPEKRLVMATDDIYYPFYLILPGETTSAKCLYVSDDNYVSIDSIKDSANCRFRVSQKNVYCKD